MMNILENIKVVRDLIKRSKFIEAEIILRAMPNIDKNPEALQLLGVVAFQTNRVSKAVVCFEKAAIYLPQDGYLQNNLAQAYKSLGSLKKAKLAFKNAAKYQATFAEPLNHLGLLFMQEGEKSRAEAAFLAAIFRNPNYAEAHYNLGVLLEKLDRLPEAREYYQKAVSVKPDYIQALNNLGTVLDALGEHKAAEKFYRKGILISSNTAELYCSLASCLCQQGKFIEARKMFLKAEDIAPNFFINKWNLGFLQLAMAELHDGWENYRYRHTVDRKICILPDKRMATKLNGQVFKVAAEQGLGDQIFFSRFLLKLKNRGAVVKFQPDPKIKSLFERVEGIEVEEFDEPDLSIGDLPYLLGNDAVIPSVIMQPQEEARLNILTKLSECGPPPYIGLTYRAGGAGDNTLHKGFPPDGIISILSRISGTVIIVQRSPGSKELMSICSLLGREIFDFSYINESLEDALALMALLDDYIGVSNTNMHLRAATGKSARVLVTHPGEFRWQVHGDISPWFPEFTLYRQDVDTNWGNAFAKIKIDVKKQYG